MARGVDAGHEGRPGDRRDRRVGRAESREAAALRQSGKIRQETFGHPALGERRIETVEPEYDDAASASRGPGRRRRQQRETNRPQHHRNDAGRDCREQREERADQRKAGARSDVRVGRVRRDEQSGAKWALT